jgi:glycosyltransferase involved in cell wall biosynthesis
MNIGVFLPEVGNAKVGGVYYYNKMLLGELFRSNTKHVFYLVVHKRTDIPASFLEEIDCNSEVIAISEFTFSSLFLKIAQRVFKKSLFPAIHKLIQREVKLLNTEKLNQKKIQFMYHLTEGQCISDSIPFSTNVWDLGHLYAPYFVEVGGNGEFELRHERFAATLPKSSVIFAESEMGRKDISFYYNIDPQKIKVLPMFPGSVVQEKATEEEQSVFLSKNSIQKNEFIFYPAQLWSHKNHYTLLKALQILIKEKKVHNLSLVLTGSDKGNLGYLNEMISSFGLTENVKFLGFVSLQEAYILYKNALALTYVSSLGPTNMPLVEAAQIGCPVICTDISGHREQLGDNALYFKSIDSQVLADAIHKVYSDENHRVQMKTTAQQFLLKGNNNASYCAKKVIEFFDEFEPIRNSWR